MDETEEDKVRELEADELRKAEDGGWTAGNLLMERREGEGGSEKELENSEVDGREEPEVGIEEQPGQIRMQEIERRRRGEFDAQWPGCAHLTLWRRELQALGCQLPFGARVPGQLERGYCRPRWSPSPRELECEAFKLRDNPASPGYHRIEIYCRK